MRTKAPLEFRFLLHKACSIRLGSTERMMLTVKEAVTTIIRAIQVDARIVAHGSSGATRIREST